MMLEPFEPDGPTDHRLALSEPPGTLRTLNEACLLTAADLRLARRVAELAARAEGRDEEHEDAVLALALCARALRDGSVCADLAALPDLDAVAWPDLAAWQAVIDGGALVAQGVLHRTGTLVHLDRYHREEEQVAADLAARASAAAPRVDEALLEAGLARHFGGERDDEQRVAARHAVQHLTTVLTGGPGTGKTTTVAGILALLHEQASAVPDAPRLRVALAAPTGKAAARLAEAIAASPALAGAPAAPPATTLHRLLGWQPGSSVRFRHHRTHPLPHDVVVVDEASMLSLTMTARLLEAVRPDARLVLVGDPDQLTSVEAGAVLADLVAGFAAAPGGGPVVRLARSHRFGGRIGAVAEALRAVGAAAEATDPPEQATAQALAAAVDRAVAAVRDGADATPDGGAVAFLPVDDGAGDDRLDAALRAHVLPHARRLREAARRGSVEDALAALAAHRLLCAHRAGPRGVASLNRAVETWLAEEDAGVVPGGTYAGRPLLVVRNDPGLGLYNGDTGVVVADAEGTLRAVFATTGAPRTLAVSRLGDVETMHATTIHKAQGSQAAEVTVVLPEAGSQLLTRELLYTAVTRAQEVVRVVGSEVALRAGVERQVQRASGLRDRLAAAPS